MDNVFPKRKTIRLPQYDYTSAGAYFVTICVKDRCPLLWDNVGAGITRPEDAPLSALGKTVAAAIGQISEHYPHITVEKHCIMPDHVHLLLLFHEKDGRQIAAPTLSVVIGQMKRWVSKTTGLSFWQKSFIDRVIRSEQGYLAVWEYIHNNPLRLDNGDDLPDLSQL